MKILANTNKRRGTRTSHKGFGMWRPVSKNAPSLLHITPPSTPLKIPEEAVQGIFFFPDENEDGTRRALKYCVMNIAVLII